MVKRRSGSNAVRRLCRMGMAAVMGLSAAVFVSAADAPKVEFRHIVFDTPLDVTPASGEKVTEAVRKFHATGKDPYVGDPEAVAEGKKLYAQWCASCHGADATGGMGPSLVSESPVYPRTKTDKGLFEAMYGGAFGAMQPFKGRITQDEMLKIVAYIQELRKKR